MRRLALLLSAVALLAAIWLSGARDDPAAPIAPAGAGDAAAAAPAPPRSAPLGAPRAENSVVAASEPVARDPIARVDWDPDARQHLTLRVVDEAAAPVAGASLRFTNLRSVEDPGTHYGWRGEESAGTTDGKGELRLAFPVWVERSRRTAKVTVRVDHPLFVTKRSDVAVAPGEDQTIVVERGGFVTVSGWIGSEGELVTEVVPRVTYGARVALDDWVRSPGRPPSTHKMEPGHHALFLTHERADGTWYSDLVEFDVVKGDRRDLRLELTKGRRLVGRLAEVVPRPVSGGEVMLCLWIARGQARGGWRFKTPVATDGSFEFAALPKGSGEIIGICDGFVSAAVARADGETPPEERRYLRPELQRVELQDDLRDFVLRMQPAATFVATVTGPDGAPLQGARVAAWPNVSWGHGVSHYFMEREFSAETDAAGVATIRDLPPGWQGYIVEAPGLAMPPRIQQGRPPERNGQIELRSGETHRVAIRLEVPRG